MDNAKKKKATTKAVKCACPYCEEEIVAVMSPFCQACGAAIRYCVKCEMPAPKNAKVCPKCSGKLTSK